MFSFVPNSAGLVSAQLRRRSICMRTNRRSSWVGVRIPAPYARTRTLANGASVTRMALAALGQSAVQLSEISDVNIRSLGVTAFVFFLTFWGGISFVKGSTKERVTQASFTVREPAGAVANKTARYLMERAFVADMEKDGRPGVITFTGEVRASTSVASILVAVAASGLWSATYILNFVLPESLKSPWWGLLTFTSLAVVPWYWKKASRKEEVKIMVESENDLSTLYVKGHRDEIAEMEKAFNWKRNEVEDYDDSTTTRDSKTKSANAEAESVVSK